ncbi:hypothetical protein [Winogradskyella sp.]|uniref:hypothetical protein n=1 Tax=Winogradskyella sp. TaxID=1883156 RepID=UPI002630A199|nr:hypothetical protein [Winogradskyella sp.]
MKIIILLFCFSTMVNAQELTVDDFKSIENLKAEVGESSGKKKARALEELYLKHNNSDLFQKILLDYLKRTDYEHVNNYFWFALYFMSDYYNDSIDLDFAIKLLTSGKTEIEGRIENKDNTEEQKLYLTMAHCQILWQTGIFYFNMDDLEKGGEFFDKAYENSNCIHAFPAPGKEKKKVIYEKYAKYREAKKN